VPTLRAPAAPPAVPLAPPAGAARAAAPGPADGLTPARRATLAAVVARVLDGAHDLAPALDAAALVEARLLRAPAATRDDLARVLDVFGSRTAACLTVGVARPFARLDAALQDRMLLRWARSRLPVQRTVFQALRRLTLAVWYGQPEVQRAVGHRGPLHDRRPAVAWRAGGGREHARRADRPRRRRRARPTAGAERRAAGDGRPRGRRPAGGRRPRARHPGRAVGGDLRRTADVVVVGSGAGGAVAAARLAEAGLEVVVLESGGLWTSDEFTERDAEMAERLYAEQGLRATVDLAWPCSRGARSGEHHGQLDGDAPPGDHVRDEWARRFGPG
jgi:choline dehydrogenase-like flavoprotein